ncbi:MAG: radical SAM family heme chaperone HemW [Acidimicrobiia bacterium]|nr:radical SAM family heme chaperone HemW [Acidimicrobiia bacterium]
MESFELHAPDSAALADAARHWRAAYVHIPFCARRCPYCDFAVVTPDEQVGPHRRYVDALVSEIGMEPHWQPLDALFIGGGTPSQLEPDQLALVIAALAERFGFAAHHEVTMEANPEDWDAETADGFLAAGVNRVSFGVQSFDATVLASLGRLHNAEQAVDAVHVAKAAGFDSVNIDLIYGAVGETVASWRATVERGLATEPDHVSMYSLTVEPGTALSRAVGAGAPAPDEDDLADKYELGSEMMDRAGLVRYEVSNFARPGATVRYNMTAWAQGEYLAFGLGAHGHREQVRRRNVRRLSAYLDMVESGNRPQAGADRIGGWSREVERVFLGIRRAAGVEAGSAGAQLLAGADGQRLVGAGILSDDWGRLRVLRPLLTDEVSRAVLSLSP